MNRKSFAVAALLVTSAFAGVTNVSAAAPESGDAAGARPPACTTPPPQPPPIKPTTVTTIGQAYYCIFDNYFSGPVLDSRQLLVPAFAALTQELQRRGLDQANATLPALKGHKDADWAAFSRVYTQIAAKLPDDAARQAAAAATLKAMVASLNDNHARWQPLPQPGEQRNIPTGIRVSGQRPDGFDPAVTGPIFVIDIAPGGGAANAGMKLGDEIIAVKDVPVIVDGVLNQAVSRWMLEGPEGKPVKMTIRRPSTNETFTADVTPVRFQLPPRGVTSNLLPGDVGYVKMPGFAGGFADAVLKAIADMRKDRTLRGVVLDLRGNGGGSPTEVSRLLGGWTRSKATSYWCDVKDKCEPNKADDTVELVNLPLIVLTDRSCASACDSFSSAVKDLKLGAIVGTRTAGAVSGPGSGFLLNDASIIGLPKVHEIGANKEVINTVGVAPDHVAPLTSDALSAGRDPGIEKALSLLTR
ncbi:carboxyl-terminal processing protease [Kibdelosporangium banguiense]|uniref:Carboxyl-terminal processing protease n=1 Tax=Kibdelosporangium banguiense TaxID=1365924 RepID=A0ABS4T7C5_9PSEU|nr:S41 family peptidase [Kibdelosporangium banguiense]MBP2320326.1 carboxyl-terminal processing protease [Kibdelosporangium banguiense]